MTQQWFIYLLTDPRFSTSREEVRYVGWTYWVSRRLTAHLNDSRKEANQYHKVRWIRSLTCLGLAPQIRVVDQGFTEDGWRESEEWYIRFYRYEVGCKLTNQTDGGGGRSTSLSKFPALQSKLQDWSRSDRNKELCRSRCSTWNSLLEPELRRDVLIARGQRYRESLEPELYHDVMLRRAYLGSQRSQELREASR